MGVDQVVAAQVSTMARVSAERLRRASPLARGGVERRILARQQGGLHACGGQAFDQPQHLPLAAAHLSSGIEVKDAHQLMFLALEYFRNV